MSRRAFTLVELGIVIAIIGVLSVIAVPNFGGDLRAVQTRQCYGEMKMLVGAIEMQRLEHPESPVVFGPGCLETLKAGDYVQKGFAERHTEPWPYLHVPGTEELACADHGLPGGHVWQSPRQQLAARGVDDAALLARMSTTPCSRRAAEDRMKARALKAFGVAAVAWVILTFIQVASRWSEGLSAEDPTSTMIGLLVSASLGIAAFVILGWDQPKPVIGNAPVIARSLAPAPPATSPPAPPATAPPAPRPKPEARSPETIKKLVRVLVMAGLVGDAFDDEIIRALRDDHPDVSSAAFFAVFRLKERLGEGAYKKVEQKLTAVVAVRVLSGALRGKVSMPELRSPAVEEALKELASSSNERLAAEARKFVH
jgi:prepilin-type N-terminal cleavage/methylation domain-containing protein